MNHHHAFLCDTVNAQSKTLFQNLNMRLGYKGVLVKMAPGDQQSPGDSYSFSDGLQRMILLRNPRNQLRISSDLDGIQFACAVCKTIHF